MELLLLAVNINFVAFSRQLADPAGQVFVFFILTVAAAEAAIGLAILVTAVPQPAHDQRGRNRLDEGLTVENAIVEHAISKTVLLAVVLAPLLGAIIAGLFGIVQVGPSAAGAHSVTILGVAVSCLLSIQVLWQLLQGAAPFNENVYTWFQVGGIEAHVGFMVDKLTAMMMVVVTFVSLLVHIYTIGYMAEDDGYQRFFSYISLFTFSMLMLVMSNNFLQLFFGWEAVGLVSYLLIGFWFKRPTAVLRQPEGVPGQPRGRLRLPARHWPACC